MTFSKDQFYQPGGGRSSGMAYSVTVLGVITNKRWRGFFWLLGLMDDHQWIANEQLWPNWQTGNKGISRKMSRLGN